MKEIINTRNTQRFEIDHRKSKNMEDYFHFEDSGLLIVERNALLLLGLLDKVSFERTHDFFEIHYGEKEDRELTILVTAEEYQFRLENTEWTEGSYAPVKTSKFWKRLITKGLAEEEIEHKLMELIEQGLKKMEDDMVTCKYCKERFPKERVIMKNVCHGCASEHEGVVF